MIPPYENRGAWMRTDGLEAGEVVVERGAP
jgi:hypothetical protein